MNVFLTIRGLTHSEIRDEREAFLQRAMGRLIWLHPAPQLLDEQRVEAFVGAKQVGCVASEDLNLFWQAMDAVRNSGNSDCDMLQGEIVEVEDYRLVTRISVPMLEKPRMAANELENWEYTGPMMYKTREEVKLEFLTARLSEDFSILGQEEVMEMLDALCPLIIHDLSREAQSFRKSLQTRLAESSCEELRQASERIEELSRRMGGETMMNKMGEWLKHELTASDEALLMSASKSNLSHIVAEARKLPKNLFELWHRSPEQMARVLYGMRAARKDIRRVLSCLVWIELKEREFGVHYDDSRDWLKFDEMIEYCKQCVSWDEARPIVNMMRSHLMKSGLHTGEKLGMIEQIEADFKRRGSGNTFNAPVGQVLQHVDKVETKTE